MIFFGTIRWIVVLGRWRINWTLTSLTVLAGISILTGLNKMSMKWIESIDMAITNLYHWLWTGPRMDVTGMVWSDRSHCSGMAGSTVAILMRERLEIHGFCRIHFFAKTKQMESGIRANFVFHALLRVCNDKKDFRVSSYKNLHR